MMRKKDENELAYSGLQELIRRDRERDGLPVVPPKEPEKDPAKVEAGRKGGIRGGRARAARLTPEQKSEIAQKAAQTRWKNK